ncbi:PREDICTED: glutathione S-transferase-like [Gekko japonicus]|uniref:glutathione transferase n=1 Tax=Gekko japonicus TaxID=146911 RepID=A0ABM1K249_GEKJA|nr:PREDICTED: glutathione S-transferase-like [Gekko japonicus]
MASKPRLHYFSGRGRMESIRWLLAAAGVEYEEEFIKEKEDWGCEKLRKDGSLLFQQVPMVEIDGMKMVQCRAILNYIAAKYKLCGKDLKENALKDHGQDYLVGNRFSRADVQLLEVILMVEELKPDVLSKFPLLKTYKGRISNIPTIKKFLQPGSARKPPTDEKEYAECIKIFY